MAGTKVLTWKDEGRKGPVRLYICLEQLEQATKGVDYGTPLPGRDLGWHTRSEAFRLAEEHGASFLET